MPPSKITNNALAEDLARSLEASTSLMKSLLGEIRDNATTLAVLQEKMESLASVVGTLSHIVKDGNGQSLVTRFALIEQEMEHLKEGIDDYKQELEEAIDEVREGHSTQEEYEQKKSLSMWKVAAVSIPGVLSLIIVIVGLFG